MTINAMWSNLSGIFFQLLTSEKTQTLIATAVACVIVLFVVNIIKNLTRRIPG